MAQLPSPKMNSRYVLAVLQWATSSLKYGIMAYAREANWTFSFMDNPDDYPFGSRQIDGLLVLAKNKRLSENFRLPYPNAKIIDLKGLLQVSDGKVHIDHERVARMAADYLLGLGYRKFLCFTCKQGEPDMTRLRCFCRYLKSKRMMVDSLILAHWPEQTVINPGDFQDLVQRKIKKTGLPLAVFALEDSYANGFIQTVLDMGYRVPEDVAVLGLNNQREICELCRVPISSVDVHLSRVGYEGARLLDVLMSGQEPQTRCIVIPPLTIERRESTELEARRDKTVGAIQEYIRQHFGEKISIKEVLRDLRLQPPALSHFRKALGHSISKEITVVRMEQARHLLSHTDYKIDAVARMAGYTNTPAFCRLFKRLHHATPAIFRKKAQS